MAKTAENTQDLPTTFQISFTVQVWKENSTYVAYAPELDVSSCGATLAQAKRRLREAATLFLEEAVRLGTLENILGEGGFRKQGQSWRAPRLLARERMRLALALTA